MCPGASSSWISTAPSAPLPQPEPRRALLTIGLNSFASAALHTPVVGERRQPSIAGHAT